MALRVAALAQDCIYIVRRVTVTGDLALKTYVCQGKSTCSTDPVTNDTSESPLPVETVPLINSRQHITVLQRRQRLSIIFLAATHH